MFSPYALFLLVPILLVSFWTFDQLVRLEYRSHRANWESDGKPHGFFFVPAECKAMGGLIVSFGSSFAFHRCVFGWLFSTPHWVKEDARARRLLLWMRVTVFIWNVGVLGGFMLPMLLFN